MVSIIYSLQEKGSCRALLHSTQVLIYMKYLLRNRSSANKVAIAPDMRPKLVDSHFLGLLPKGHL